MSDTPYVRKDGTDDYVVVDGTGNDVSRHSCRDWADQALHRIISPEQDSSGINRRESV